MAYVYLAFVASWHVCIMLRYLKPIVPFQINICWYRKKNLFRISHDLSCDLIHSHFMLCIFYNIFYVDIWWAITMQIDPQYVYIKIHTYTKLYIQRALHRLYTYIYIYRLDTCLCSVKLSYCCSIIIPLLIYIIVLTGQYQWYVIAPNDIYPISLEAALYKLRMYGAIRSTKL